MVDAYIKFLRTNIKNIQLTEFYKDSNYESFFKLLLNKYVKK